MDFRLRESPAEITEDGEIRTMNIYYEATNNDVVSPCEYYGAGYVFTNETWGPFYMNYLDGYDANDYLTIPDPADCTFAGGSAKYSRLVCT